MTQSPLKHNDEALIPLKKVGERGATKSLMCIKPCHTRRTSATDAQEILSFPATIGKRSTSKRTSATDAQEILSFPATIGKRIKGDIRHEEPRKTAMEQLKASADSASRSSHMSRISHASISKSSSSDSQESVPCPSSKAPVAQNVAVSSGTIDSTSTLQSQSVSFSHLQNKSSSDFSEKGERLSKVTHSSSMHHLAYVSTSSTLSDKELALLLHQELNGSSRVRLAPCMHRASNITQLASLPTTSMRKRTSSSFLKDQIPGSRRKSIEQARLTSTTSFDQSFHTEATDQNLLALWNSPNDTSDYHDDAGRIAARTLPGLLDELLSKGRHMTYEELCTAVLPHWNNLKKHDAEQYTYSTHSQAVLDCLCNRNEWTHLVDKQTVDIPKSKNVVESVLSLDSVDITTNTNSSPMQQNEGSLPLQDGSWPFIKNSHLWGIIESMEVFQLMPQQPHFRPLEQYNEEIREGFAIGNMLNFANLVERTWKSKLDEPRTKFENRLKMLTDLEEFGFTVQPIQTRLEELLKIKDKYSQLDDKSKMGEREFIEEKRKFDELQKSIAELNSESQTLVVEREKKGSSVAELQRRLDAINKNMQVHRLDFENEIAAPLASNYWLRCSGE